jgi:hypothetical protein
MLFLHHSQEQPNRFLSKRSVQDCSCGTHLIGILQKDPRISRFYSEFKMMKGGNDPPFISKRWLASSKKRDNSPGMKKNQIGFYHR